MTGTFFCFLWLTFLHHWCNRIKFLYATFMLPSKLFSHGTMQITSDDILWPQVWSNIYDIACILISTREYWQFIEWRYVQLNATLQQSKQCLIVSQQCQLNANPYSFSHNYHLLSLILTFIFSRCFNLKITYSRYSTSIHNVLKPLHKSPKFDCQLSEYDEQFADIKMTNGLSANSKCKRIKNSDQH